MGKCITTEQFDRLHGFTDEDDGFVDHFSNIDHSMLKGTMIQQKEENMASELIDKGLDSLIVETVEDIFNIFDK